MIQKVHLFVRGDVIGVGFRSWTIYEARKLGLSGWVKNTEDRNVEAVAEGPREKLIEFVDRCQEGPETSWVEKVDVEWNEATGEYKEFNVR